MRLLLPILLALLELAHDLMHHAREGFDLRILNLYLPLNGDFGYVLGVASGVILGVAGLLERWVRLEGLKLKERRTTFPADLIPSKSLYVEIVYLVICVLRIAGSSLGRELLSQRLNLPNAHFANCSDILLGLYIASVGLMVTELIYRDVLHMHRICCELHTLLWAIL